MTIEIRKPTSETDSSGWTNPSHSYDNTTVAGDSTTAATDTISADFDPSIVFDTWADSGSTAYTSLILGVRYASTGFADDEFGIHYRTGSGAPYVDLVALGFRNQSIITVSASLAPSQSLADLSIKVSMNRSAGPDGGTLSIYDIWTSGEFVEPLIVSASAMSARGTSVDPNVIQGTIQYTPAPIIGPTSVLDPTTVQGSLTIVPDPISDPVEMVDPKVVSPIKPLPMIASSITIDPVVIQSSIIIVPVPAQSVGKVNEPTTIQGSIVFIPDAMIASTEFVIENIIGGIPQRITDVSRIIGITRINM